MWAREADVKFGRLVGLLENMQRAGALAMRIEQREDGEAVAIVLRRKRAKKADASAVAKILGLDPGADAYQVTYGAVARSNREIAMQTRSIFEIMIELSVRVQAPKEHVSKGYVPAVSEGNNKLGGVPFHVQSGATKPSTSYAAVRYLDHWFWIAQNDESSKIDFVFLMLLFSLVETREGQTAPIVTVPVN
jgi:hypothetical protein